MLERELLYTCLNNPKIKLTNHNQTFGYQWCGNGSELLELMLALFSSGRIKSRDDDKEIRFAAFASDYQRFCNYKIEDIKGRKIKLMMRKKNQVPFLQALEESLSAHINHYFE